MNPGPIPPTPQMDRVVKDLLVEHLTANPGAHPGETWPVIAQRATKRMREPVSESYVCGVFWVMVEDQEMTYEPGGAKLWLTKTT